MAELTPEEVEGITEALPEFTEAMAGLSKSVVALGGVILSTTSAIMGYYVAYKRLQKQYAERADAEIAEMREHFRAKLVVRESKPDLTDLSRKVQELGYTPDDEKDVNEVAPPGEVNTPAVPEEVRNVFAENSPARDKWDFEVERALRNGNQIYVIHLDERHERDDFDEVTLTYYQGDDVLCDQHDKPVDDHDMVVGLENLDKFGHGSGDPNIVYIRNEALSIDVEVVKSEKTYAEEVHGFKHEDTPRRRRTRPEE